MFTKRITPFACTVIALVVCLFTVVATVSIVSVDKAAELNDQRLDSAGNSNSGTSADSTGDDAEKYAKLAEMIDMIEGYYLHGNVDDEIWESIYKSLAYSLGDAYSEYLTAEEYRALTESADGDFVGIGVHATFDVDTEGVYIFGVMPDSPAQKAGLLKGDIVIAVEDIQCNDETYYEVLDAVRGETGTDVHLTILRGEEKIDFTITRQAVAAENVLYEKLDGNIALVRILSFADTSVAQEFTKKIALAQSEGCTKFIFDVRNNTGGYLDQICAVLDLLLPEGPIINYVDKHGNVQTQNSDSNCIKGEMVVICNDGTASAAELFTAALRDYKLAKTVGITTFGKGTMQTTRFLEDGSALKLSVAYYNPPSNVSYDKVGIKPDYEVKLDEEWESRFFKMPKENDAQLQKALEILNGAN